MSVAAADAQAVLARCQTDPEFFITDVLGWEPTPAARAHGYTSPLTPDQLLILRSVRDHRRTAVPAAVGVGKTRDAAALVLWFLYCFVQSKVVTTAPGAFQVEQLLWREIRQAHTTSRVPLGGRLLTTQLELDENWFAVGLSPQKDKEGETATRFQGFHAPRILIILDEATGVHPSIWEAAEGLAVGPQDRLLALGNPTDPTSTFKQKCDSGRWHVIPLSALTHPNVIHNDPLIIPGATTKEWVDEHLEDYGGPDTALARAKIFGKWPEQGDEMLISLKWVEDAQARWQPPVGTPLAGGCDVARTGGDETIIQLIYPGGVFDTPAAYHEPNLMATVGRLYTLRLPFLAVDDSGLGGGVTDRLVEQGAPVLPVNAAQAADDSEHFANARAEMYWHLREALRRDEIALPPDTKLAADLTSIKWSQDSKGRILLEKKEDIRSRLKRSPDRGDGAALAWRVYRQAVGAGVSSGGPMAGKPRWGQPVAGGRR